MVLGAVSLDDITALSVVTVCLRSLLPQVEGPDHVFDFISPDVMV